MEGRKTGGNDGIPRRDVLTPDELALLRAFRECDRRGKDMVLYFAEGQRGWRGRLRLC